MNACFVVVYLMRNGEKNQPIKKINKNIRLIVEKINVNRKKNP